MSKEPLPPDIKPYPFNGYAPGNYMNKCSSCGTMMERVDKLCFVCLECAIKGAISEISLQKAEIERLNAALSEAYAEIKELRRQIDEESPNELDNIF